MDSEDVLIRDSCQAVLHCTQSTLVVLFSHLLHVLTTGVPPPTPMSDKVD